MPRVLFKVVSLWVQIRDLYLYLFKRAIIVNAWIDDHTWRGLNHRNWGDDINYYFIKELTRRPVVSLFNFRLARKFKFKNFLCIGSLLGMPGYANENTIVWGAGSFGELKGVVPKHICSVRGKLTCDILIETGIDCPEVYGDPALLLPLMYQPQRDAPPSTFPRRGGALFETRNSKLETKRYRLGIIPHIDDLHHPVIEEIREKHADEILIIDLALYSEWTNVIDQICSCECILSSSLHGLIVSDAYQVPSCWIELTGKILGGHFKYYDYASSVGRVFDKPYPVEKIEDVVYLSDNAESHFSCADAEKITELQQGLIETAPFKLKINLPKESNENRTRN